MTFTGYFTQVKILNYEKEKINKCVLLVNFLCQRIRDYIILRFFMPYMLVKCNTQDYFFIVANMFIVVYMLF